MFLPLLFCNTEEVFWCVFVCLRPWDSALCPFDCHGLVTLRGVKINKPYNDNDSSTGHVCVCAPFPWSEYGNVETFSVSMGNKCCLFSLHISACTSVHPSASLPNAILLDFLCGKYVTVYLSIILSSVV